MRRKSKKKIGGFNLAGLRNPCKTLLANIRFASLDHSVKAIVITSSAPDEGKSTVASNLACAIAGAGNRVLLMECDMRRRCLGEMLGEHGSVGVCAVLAGQSSLDDAIIQTDIPNLCFLDGEPNVPNPPDMFSTKRFEILLDSLRSKYDYIIMDTPPLSTFVDAAIVSSVADGVALCVRQGKSKVVRVEEALQQLNAASAKILGIVMTFVKDKESDRYYYAYYNQDGKRVGREEMISGEYRGDNTDVADSDINDWARQIGIDIPEAVLENQSTPEVLEKNDGNNRSSDSHAAARGKDTEGESPNKRKKSSTAKQGKRSC